MVGVIVGGRLGHVFLYARAEFVADPLMVFRIWQGGMASHGGFLGVLLAGLWSPSATCSAPSRPRGFSSAGWPTS
ncbi:MAG: hypothetical protein RI910_2041 [Verrucomicrobiota bacterium]